VSNNSDDVDKMAEGQPDAVGPVTTPGNMAKSSSRRTFTRQAVLGSAVMLSLGNRNALGQIPDGCLSADHYHSIAAGFASTYGNNSVKQEWYDTMQVVGVDQTRLAQEGIYCPAPPNFGPPSTPDLGPKLNRQRANMGVGKNSWLE
jgi:hypothetical protein